jgi:hypothetical protein
MKIDILQYVYVHLTEQGAYFVGRAVDQYVAPGWLAAPLAFIAAELGDTMRSEGGGHLWNRYVNASGPQAPSLDAAIYVDLPPGAKVATRISQWNPWRVESLD